MMCTYLQAKTDQGIWYNTLCTREENFIFNLPIYWQENQEIELDSQDIDKRTKISNSTAKNINNRTVATELSSSTHFPIVSINRNKWL